MNFFWSSTIKLISRCLRLSADAPSRFLLQIRSTSRASEDVPWHTHKVCSSIFSDETCYSESESYPNRPVALSGLEMHCRCARWQHCNRLQNTYLTDKSCHFKALLDIKLVAVLVPHHIKAGVLYVMYSHLTLHAILPISGEQLWMIDQQCWEIILLCQFFHLQSSIES